MIDYELMAALDRMDYSGTLREWLGRIPPDVLYALRDCLNDGSLKPVLYATINRLNEEAGNPADGFETNTEQLNRSATLLGGFLTMLSMERDGCVIVDWPLLLTYNPASTVRVRATDKGRARMKELELKAALG
jgi:hypothetical protein